MHEWGSGPAPPELRKASRVVLRSKDGSQSLTAFKCMWGGELTFSAVFGYSSPRSPDQTRSRGQGHRTRGRESGAEPHVPSPEGLHDREVPGPGGGHQQDDPGQGDHERNDVLPDTSAFQVRCLRTVPGLLPCLPELAKMVAR